MLLRAISTKLLTTRIWWVLAVVLFGYSAMLLGGLAALFAGIQSGAIDRRAAGTGSPGTPPLGSLPPLAYSFVSSVGYVSPVLLGALATTGEFRHQTLTPTFRANPRRAQVPPGP